MADPARRRSRARLRTALGWVLTLTIVLYSIVDWGDDDDDRIAAAAGDGDGDDKLRIRTISDAEVSPGDAVVVRFDNADDDLPIGARVAGEAATILDRRAHSLVVRIPDDVAPGRAPLRLMSFNVKAYQADNDPAGFGRLAWEIALHDADVIAMQDANFANTEESLPDPIKAALGASSAGLGRSGLLEQEASSTTTVRAAMALPARLKAPVDDREGLAMVTTWLLHQRPAWPSASAARTCCNGSRARNWRTWVIRPSSMPWATCCTFPRPMARASLPARCRACATMPAARPCCSTSTTRWRASR